MRAALCSGFFASASLMNLLLGFRVCESEYLRPESARFGRLRTALTRRMFILARSAQHADECKCSERAAEMNT